MSGSYKSRSNAAAATESGAGPHKFMRRRSSSEPVNSPTGRTSLGKVRVEQHIGIVG